MNSVNEIRSLFLDYYRRNGHEVVPSGLLVPRNDPTLMFINAGMVPFKNVFTGLEKRPYTRATSAQKCVRAGGKHNDLDNVGYTARHHTFFEMMGNFSFGDYFKEEAIYFAWNLLTKEFCLPAEKLLVTVYHDDETAANLWKKIAGLPDEKIIRIATSDNFWTMGDTGPCGPCSEVFYDHGEAIAGGPPGSPDEDGDRFIEIWNIVFMQYEQISANERIALPHPSIDTGMGLERVAAVLQGVHDNYDIDLFKTLIHASEEATGVRAKGELMASHRIIADHLRSSAFLIADGVLPSNEGRGYVLRRIMRRAMRHAQLLGTKDPLMWRLLPTLVHEMGQAYPELLRAESLISETLNLEETRFRKTLERGLSLLTDASSSLNEGDQLDGDVAFKLYDTYGFPLDLTQDALRRRGISVDISAFDNAMARQKAEARANWSGSGQAATEAVWFSIHDKVGPTEFLGYETEKSEGIVTAIVLNDQIVKQAKADESCMLVVNQTPFYGESGGQVGDSGFIYGDNFTFEVQDTQRKVDGVFVHVGKVISGVAEVNEAVELCVDQKLRAMIRANHSATHLLHQALREVLGDHISQKGSMVSAERLRFDFSHPKPIAPSELEKVEDLVNEIVLQNSAVQTRLMAVDDAMSQGAMALFGEKYGEEVRVVSMGQPLANENERQHAWSMELCGGTHVYRTGEIGLIRIVSEGAVAAGVRRIEALTGRGARRYLNKQDERVKDITAFLKTTPQNSLERLKTLSEERRKFEKELSVARREIALGGGHTQKTGRNSEQDFEVVNNVHFIGRVLRSVLPRDLKSLADSGKKQLTSGIVVFISVSDDDKASVVVGVSDDLKNRHDAVALVRIAAKVLGGQGGGGRPDMAQAGGPHGDKAHAAIEAIRNAI